MQSYMNSLVLTPRALKRIIDTVPAEDYSEKKGPERFSLIEMVAHVVDWEDILLERLRTAVEFPGKTIEAVDESLRAKEKHYNDRNIHHELDVFENRRIDTMALLQGLSEEDMTKSVVHPTRGTITIHDMVFGLLAHDLYHLEQASEYLR